MGVAHYLKTVEVIISITITYGVENLHLLIGTLP